MNKELDQRINGHKFQSYKAFKYIPWFKHVNSPIKRKEKKRIVNKMKQQLKYFSGL